MSTAKKKRFHWVGYLLGESFVFTFSADSPVTRLVRNRAEPFAYTVNPGFSHRLDQRPPPCNDRFFMPRQFCKSSTLSWATTCLRQLATCILCTNAGKQLPSTTNLPTAQRAQQNARVVPKLPAKDLPVRAHYQSTIAYQCCPFT